MFMVREVLDDYLGKYVKKMWLSCLKEESTENSFFLNVSNSLDEANFGQNV